MAGYQHSIDNEYNITWENTIIMKRNFPNIKARFITEFLHIINMSNSCDFTERSLRLNDTCKILFDT